MLQIQDPNDWLMNLMEKWISFLGIGVLIVIAAAVFVHRHSKQRPKRDRRLAVKKDGDIVEQDVTESFYH